MKQSWFDCVNVTGAGREMRKNFGCGSLAIGLRSSEGCGPNGEWSEREGTTGVPASAVTLWHGGPNSNLALRPTASPRFKASGVALPIGHCAETVGAGGVEVIGSRRGKTIRSGRVKVVGGSHVRVGAQGFKRIIGGGRRCGPGANDPVAAGRERGLGSNRATGNRGPAGSHGATGSNHAAAAGDDRAIDNGRTTRSNGTARNQNAGARSLAAVRNHCAAWYCGTIGDHCATGSHHAAGSDSGATGDDRATWRCSLP